MILGSPAQHHEETCRRARQVYSRCGTAPEASVDDHGAMASHCHLSALVFSFLSVCTFLLFTFSLVGYVLSSLESVFLSFKVFLFVSFCLLSISVLIYLSMCLYVYCMFNCLSVYYA